MKIWAGFLLIFSLGCSQDDQPVERYPVLTEAYELLDRGERDKAILLLERHLDLDPGHREAAVVLASAYAGKAGVDIYAIYDTFGDILFSDKLADTLWSKEDSPEDVVGIQKEGELTPVEKVIDTLDRFLNLLRRFVQYFSRLPSISESNWPLIDRSLEILDEWGTERDVAFYRLTLRVIYLRDYLSVKIVGDPTVGTRSWLCSLRLVKIYDGLDWVAESLLKSSKDFDYAFPKREGQLTKVHEKFDFALARIDSLSDSAPAGSATGLYFAQEQLHSALKCGDPEDE